MTAAEKIPEQNSQLRRKLWVLILGRLGVGLILLFVSTIWTRSTTDSRSSSLTISVLLFVLFLTLLYSLVHHFTNALLFQARLQFAVDILLVTWLVWTSDVINSPYTALYIVIIAISSLFLGPRGAVITSVGCGVAFTGCALAVMTGLGSQPAYLLDDSLSRAVQSVGLFNIAFFVVGLLSARLAQQQSGSDVRLKAATQSLANLRALHERIVESIRSGVVTTDLEGRIFTFNAAAEEITGYDEKDVRGQGASVFFGELGDHINNLVRASDKRVTSPRFEADCLTAEGMRLRLGFSISPLSAESGETTGMVITFQDLTHIRALEETSRRQDQLAAIGRMAASIAHEIRNPLAAMRGSIQMLRHEMQGEPAQAELMEIILRESDRLNRIITDFLNYARPRSASHAKVDVGELLRQTFTLLRYSPEINERQSVEEELIDGPLMADADAEQLQQVFWNLARNALQSMPDGGVLRAQISRNVRNRLTIMFSDNGRGMSPAQVEHLFEPFSSTTGGTGLGLSIVYQIIREHGGTINVRSREGQGTTITIEIPGEKQEARSQ
ncbi:MAG: ATP-binding protein [Pyrinomonadaceae bacterium]|nr:ATP-binding protein [Pyrinomonadaceae bacterium]